MPTFKTAPQVRLKLLKLFQPSTWRAHFSKLYLLFLRICNYFSDDETTFELRLSTFQKVDDRPPLKHLEYLHTIPIKTVRDLELLENFWYTKDPNKKRKYKKQLLAKATKSTQVSFY